MLAMQMFAVMPQVRIKLKVSRQVDWHHKENAYGSSLAVKSLAFIVPLKRLTFGLFVSLKLLTLISTLVGQSLLDIAYCCYTHQDYCSVSVNENGIY